jgi:hypothetical protein
MFWMTSLQVLAGGLATLTAVWIGASLALRGQRKSVAEQRARLAAEQCLRAIDLASRDINYLVRDLKLAMRYSIDLDEARSSAIKMFSKLHDDFLETDLGTKRGFSLIDA